MPGGGEATTPAAGAFGLVQRRGATLASRAERVLNAGMSDTVERPADAVRVAEDGLADFDPRDAFDASDERDEGGGAGGPSPAPGSPGRFLTDMADVLRRAGLRVKEVDGWQQRSRASGGYRPGRPLGIIVHHTASGPHHDGQSDVNFLTFTCPVKPMANLYLDRSGQFWVLAGGATNTNGEGGPLGPLPVHEANSRVIGIEAGNDGLGEPWAPAQQDAYVAGVAALANAYDIKTENIFSHFEWAPGRKIDPAGPSRFGSITPSQTWDMTAFRDAVDRARKGLPPTTEPLVVTRVVIATGSTYVVRPGDGWWNIAEKTMGNPAVNWLKLAEANGGRDRVLRPGDVLTVPATAGAPPPPPPGVPPFPGEAQLHDRGPVVLAWQLALIARGVIRDNDENRDQHYGTGMRDAVLALQRSFGWTDADGKAGKHTWSRLHGGP
jgi:hypothetical protein